MEILRLTDASATSEDTHADADGLPLNQQEALRAAVEHGYYATPREVDVADLAERLDVPRSTLTYRLRRAEAHMAKRFVDRDQFSEETAQPL